MLVRFLPDGGGRVSLGCDGQVGRFLAFVCLSFFDFERVSVRIKPGPQPHLDEPDGALNLAFAGLCVGGVFGASGA